MASLSPKAKVLRDGKFGEIDAADLVPGDIVLVKFGEVLPADIKIMGTVPVAAMIVLIEESCSMSGAHH